ncbi:MAG: GFA family protein [Proteobacteria bacterium]|nr:GFA family protein [Pseudomonadota bacterium]
MIVRGSCLCGAVAFEVRLPFGRFVNCHCNRCRKTSGSAHSANAAVAPEAFRWTRGETAVTRYDLPPARSFATAFCSTCGSPLPHLTRSGREVIIPAGTLDDDPGVKPDRHIHWSSRAAWTCPASDLPTSD